jgi:hypothetical protein
MSGTYQKEFVLKKTIYKVLDRVVVVVGMLQNRLEFPLKLLIQSEKK